MIDMPEGERFYIDDEVVPWDVDNSSPGDAEVQDLVSEDDYGQE
jgi:hypothetical protein